MYIGDRAPSVRPSPSLRTSYALYTCLSLSCLDTRGGVYEPNKLFRFCFLRPTSMSRSRTVIAYCYVIQHTAATRQNTSGVPCAAPAMAPAMVPAGAERGAGDWRRARGPGPRGKPMTMCATAPGTRRRTGSCPVAAPQQHISCVRHGMRKVRHSWGGRGRRRGMRAPDMHAETGEGRCDVERMDCRSAPVGPRSPKRHHLT